MTPTESSGNKEEGKWTVETLREYLLALLRESDDKTNARVDALQELLDRSISSLKEATRTAMCNSERAILKAEAAAEKRFDAVNEFRSVLADQQQKLLPRSEADIKFQSLANQMDQAIKHQALSQGLATGRKEMWGYLVGVVGLGLTIMSIFVLIFRLLK
jgi:hypothetical protein